MTSEWEDDDLRRAFTIYRRQAHGNVRPAGVLSAQRKGIGRRRRRHGFLSAAAALALTTPAAAFALIQRGERPTGAIVLPTPTSSAGIPLGGLTRGQLLVSSMAMPVWKGDTTGTCPHGEVGLADERLTWERWLNSERVDYADIDQDGVFETVLHLRCLHAGKVVAQQVVAVSPGAGASLRVRGRVVGTGGEIAGLGRLSVQPDGRIRVVVDGPRKCCEGFSTAVEHQTREYRWFGDGFAQSGGSVSFHPATADLIVSVPEVSFAGRSAKLLMSVTNAGATRVEGIRLRLVAQGIRVESGWNATIPGAEPNQMDFEQVIDGLAAGETVTVEVPLRTTSAEPVPRQLWAAAVARTTGTTELVDELADVTPHDNEKIQVGLRF